MSSAHRQAGMDTSFLTPQYLEELFDLVLLGLSWVQNDSEILTGWTAHGILQTMARLRVISERELAIAEADYRTASFFMQKLCLQRPQKGCPRNARTGRYAPPSQGTLRDLVRQSPEPAVALVDTYQLVYRSLVGRYGYRLLLTQAGRQHAQQVAERYAPRLTQQCFRTAWEVHTRQMRAVHAAVNETRGAGSSWPR